MQVAERCCLALALAQPGAHRLEQAAQLRSVIELGGEVAIVSRSLSHERRWVGGTAGAMLVDRAAVGDDCQPANRVGDMPTLEHGRVKALPSLRVSALEVVPVEHHAITAQSRGGAADDPFALLLELFAQQTIGTVAAQE